jgi:glutaminyl-peptide cyclotransferase
MNRSKLTVNGKPLGLVILIVTLSITLVLLGLLFLSNKSLKDVFDGERALRDVEAQLAFGPRTPGSEAHRLTANWIYAELEDINDTYGWLISRNAVLVDDHKIENILACLGAGHPYYLLGAHYDSRALADRDPDPMSRTFPVPGANDGASGVAVLLGLARSLSPDLPGQVCLVFFDAEDQGDLAGWDWIQGSSYFAEHLQGRPDGVAVVDMVGDSDLNIYREGNSDPALTEAIWDVAADYGFEQQFQDSFKYTMLDDHLPFVEKGIPAALLIDFDYPWWHTAGDTLDKVSAESLDAVGTTLYYWLVDAMGK